MVYIREGVIFLLKSVAVFKSSSGGNEGAIRMFLSLGSIPPGNADPAVKTEKIEWIATQIIAELKRQDMVSGNGNDLEKFAFELQSRIINREIASLHIMDGA